MASHPDFGKETTAEKVASAFAANIEGKTIVVTGVNPNGLGAAACHALASHNPAMLIMTARSTSKPYAVIDTIKSANPSTTTRFEVVELDLSSLTSVRKGASAIAQLTSSIDILLNNAGVMAIPERTLSPDGVEMHLATNFLGHFLLTSLLQLQLKAARNGSRVVNITSAGFVLTPFRFSDYNFDGDRLPPEERVDVGIAEKLGFAGLPAETGYMPFVAYAQANVANMLFSVGLGEKFERDGVLGFSAAPGVVVTDLQRHLPADFRNPGMFYKTSSQGVASFLVAALDPALKSHPASYINDCQITGTVPHVTSSEMASRLWQLAEELAQGRKQ